MRLSVMLLLLLGTTLGNRGGVGGSILRLIRRLLWSI